MKNVVRTGASLTMSIRLSNWTKLSITSADMQFLGLNGVSPGEIHVKLVGFLAQRHDIIGL